MRNVLVGLSAGMILSAGAAVASPISFTAAVDFSTAPFNFVADGTYLVSFDQFNPGVNAPSDAELTGVSIEWTASLEANGNYTAFTVGGITGWTAEATITGTGPSALAVVLAPAAPLVTAPGFTFLAGDTGTVGPANDTDVIVQSGLLPLATFIGAGLVTWDFGGSLVNTVTSTGAVSTDSSGIGGVTGTITYTYDQPTETVVPVPAALPLLATAIGAFGVWRIRRKA